MSRRAAENCSGFTLIEVLVTLSLAFILSMIAIMNLKELDNPLTNGSAQLASFFKQVRSRAVSSTLAYTIYPSTSDRIETRFAERCSDGTTTDDDTLVLDLPTGASLTDTDWTLCYSARGLPDGTLEVEVYDGEGQYKTVEVFLGGAVRVSD